MSTFDEDDWLARRIDTLRPGWRGRLLLQAPEEAKSGEHEEVIGTVVDEPAIDRGADDDDVIDAAITLCANYRDGRFVPVTGEPRFSIRISQVVEMDAMP